MDLSAATKCSRGELDLPAAADASFLFREQKLRQPLERNGFKVFRIERVGRTLILDRFISNAGLAGPSPRSQRFLAGAAKRLHLQERSFYINLRDMQRMYARAA